MVKLKSLPQELHDVFCSGLVVASGPCIKLLERRLRHDWDQVIINSDSLKKGASAVYHERFRRSLQGLGNNK